MKMIQSAIFKIKKNILHCKPYNNFSKNFKHSIDIESQKDLIKILYRYATMN